jgi:hypothetical protein
LTFVFDDRNFVFHDASQDTARGLRGSKEKSCLGALNGDFQLSPGRSAAEEGIWRFGCRDHSLRAKSQPPGAAHQKNEGQSLLLSQEKLKLIARDLRKKPSENEI